MNKYFCFFLLFFLQIKTENPKITILTQPIGSKKEGYTGHFGVTRSLIEGFKIIGNINFNYNPLKANQIGEIVCVLSDINALKQSIILRRYKKIKKLVAGPNLMVRSNDYDNILVAPEIDLYLVNSEWTKKAYIEDQPSLQNRIKIWYAGVDENYWNSKNKQFSNNVLIYQKTESEEFFLEIEKILRDLNWNPIRLHYGHYTKEQFKENLAKSEFAIFVSRIESQGLALVECWSMNIPTFVWDPQKPHFINNRLYDPISAAPYLTTNTGVFWKNFDELQEILKNANTLLKKFNPRKWVLENNTDEITSKIFLKLIFEN